ncbi:hypothetical protein KAFR_0A06220 [Kazachstania africana CBS 2517]|uniref:Uncharacterized protein n=1 Tax=Kazachstania africana (strain ATCC 22294 / BCRC 22015 / CBS 2517 / CECT 1963 / NBRC 1671 / NRRL Y-8276) TaxID=1071382 RepID=H2ANV7_KAZAF|nr:hypothetical protein KAFR_0A06220 [Kazachstania africana CBS 2517]CCF56057.1 hypothetical protein KAFR_0A06220 [Kazachstania africana CBS 2517]
MATYLLEKKLRHVNSITLNNVCLPIKKPIENLHIIRVSRCFFIIESFENDGVIYVSEIQSVNCARQVQFNDFSLNGNPATCLCLKVVLEIPAEVTQDNTTSWMVARNINIDLNSLQAIDSKNDIVSDYNVPTFNMIDQNEYIPSAHLITYRSPKNNESLVQNVDLKRSANFNDLLKLNRLLDYMGQISEETISISNKVDVHISGLGINQYHLSNVDTSKKVLRKGISKKKLQVRQLKNELKIMQQSSEEYENDSELVHSDTETNSDDKQFGNNDEFGYFFSEVNEKRNQLQYLRAKKYQQLIDIFQITGLFDPAHGLIEVSYDENGERYLQFNTVDSVSFLKEINEENKLELNAMLGYYLLFLKLISKKIYSLELPHKLMYYGSTSVINNIYPLYYPDVGSVKSLHKFSQAMKFFNINILQIRQYLTKH